MALAGVPQAWDGVQMTISWDERTDLKVYVGMVSAVCCLVLDG